MLVKIEGMVKFDYSIEKNFLLEKKLNFKHDF